MIDRRDWRQPTEPEVDLLMRLFAALPEPPSAAEIAERIGIRGGERQVRKWRAGQELHKITFEAWHLMRLLYMDMALVAGALERTPNS